MVSPEPISDKDKEKIRLGRLEYDAECN